jgi:hypothetical protein
MTVRAARTALVFRPGIRARSSFDSVCWLPFGVEAGCTRVPLARARTWPAAGRLFPLPARIRCTAGVSKQQVRQPSDSSGYFPIFLRIFGYSGCSFFGQAILVFSDSRFNPSRGKEEIRGFFIFGFLLGG